MAEIYAETVAVNRYAPENVADIELFGYNGVEQLTLTQLVNAVVVRRCAIVERQSVVQMNLLSSGSENLGKLAAGAEWIFSDEAVACTDWSKVDNGYYQLLNNLLNGNLKPGETPTSIPLNLTTWNNRLAVFELFKTQIDNANAAVDRIAVDLQTSVSRRDSLYNISTTVTSRSFIGLNDMATKLR